MSDRQLVTVRTVAEIQPIEGADNIVCAKIDGWQCVVKKGEFAPGDKAVFFEVDSLLNVADPRFAFLAPKAKAWKDGQWARLRTIRLKKCLSQGLALPVRHFQDEIDEPDAVDYTDSPLRPVEGESRTLAQRIGVEKWEEEIAPQMQGLQKGTFPIFLQKSDQERIQNLRIEGLRAHEYEATLKLDGTSLTVFARFSREVDGAETGICSRNVELKDDESNAENLYIRAGRLTGLRDKLSATQRDLAVQAEICGPGIQSNRLQLDRVAVYIYDVFDIDAQRFVGMEERLSLVKDWLTEDTEIPLRMCPIIRTGLCPELESLESALSHACALRYPSGALAEGVVYKRLDGSDSFKVISNEYLLKHNL